MPFNRQPATMELINSDQKIVAAFHPAGMSQVGQFLPRQRILPPAHFRFAPKADVRS